MGSVNPYLIVKDLAEKIVSIKYQLKVLVFILISIIYEKIFPNNFLSLKIIILKIIPLNIKIILEELIIPTLNFLYFIGLFGIILFVILVVILYLNERKGWFENFISNYKDAFMENSRGIFNNLVSSIVVIPVNIGLIIEGIAYIFNNKLIDDYIKNTNIINFVQLLVLQCYFYIFLTFFFRRADD